MSNKKAYYKYLDIIRVFFCLAILLYHFDIIKGGYLAVCSFFALSGYLSCVSSFRNEHFSIKQYYISRIKKVYIPLIIVVFLTLSVVSLFDNIIWLNLKPETTSILMGFNNYWQLSVNLDYFAHHIDSPFMHLWYVSILLQFELVFPIIYITFKKMGDKVSKILPILISLILGVLSFIYFCNIYKSGNLMGCYYGTLARVFSILFGLAIGIIHAYYKPLVPKTLSKKIPARIIIGLYMVLLAILFLTIDASSKYFVIGMILSTFFAIRLIDYSCAIQDVEASKYYPIIKYLSNISYEIFLTQYPVIFLFQYVKMNMVLKLILITIIVLLISSLIHFALKNNKKYKILRLLVALLLILGSFYGEYIYHITEDHSKEMQQLEKELNDNAEDLLKRQEEYQREYENATKELEDALKNLDESKANIKNLVSNLPVVGIGDSVMLGAVNSLYDVFPNGYFDGKVSRTAYAANDILIELKNQNLLSDNIVFHLGTNGDCSKKCKEDIMKTIGDRQVYWVTVTNDEEVHFNDKIKEYAQNYDNVHIIDWASISKGHSEYFFADGIHLTPSGRKAYAEAVYNAIYERILEQFNKQKEELINKHEEELKNKITFFGNDLLINSFDKLESKFPKSVYNIDKNWDNDSLIKKIEKDIQNDTLSNKLVFAFDTSINIDYDKIIEICKGRKIYIASMSNNNLNNIDNKDINIIDFNKEILNNDGYLMVDNIHLTEKGNEELLKMLENVLKAK